MRYIYGANIMVMYMYMYMYMYMNMYICMHGYTPRVSLCVCMSSGFFPHWSGVVGPNHHSAIFTITQASSTTTHRV
jgi:hypothetical protein